MRAGSLKVPGFFISHFACPLPCNMFSYSLHFIMIVSFVRLSPEADAGSHLYNLPDYEPNKHFFLFFFFWDCHAGWTAVAQSWLTVTSASSFKWFTCPNLPSSCDYRHTPPHLANFVFLVETGFHHVGQAPGWSAVVQSQLTATSAFQDQAFLLPQPPE